jgi:hypothetical protein
MFFLVFSFYNPININPDVNGNFSYGIKYSILLFLTLFGVLFNYFFKLSKEDIILSIFIWPLISWIVIGFIKYFNFEFYSYNLNMANLILYFIPITISYFLGIKLIKIIKNIK